MAGGFGVNVTLNVNANEIAILMSEMAKTLDLASDLIIMKDTKIRTLERQVKILSEDVTLEGNNV